MLDGLRDEDSSSELCRRVGIAQGIYYIWSKDFMQAGKLLPAQRSRSPNRGVCRSSQSPTLPRDSEQRHTRQCLLRTPQSNSTTKGKDQTKDNSKRGACITENPPHSCSQRDAPNSLLVKAANSARNPDDEKPRGDCTK